MAETYRFPGVSRDLSQNDSQQQLQLAYERGRQEGLQQGIEQGSKQAEQQALQQAEQQVQQQQQQALAQLKQHFSQQLQQLQQQLQGQQQLQQQQLTQALFELVSSLAKTTLEAELQLSTVHLKRAIQTTLPLLQLDDKIRAIHLSPADFALWQQMEIELLGDITLQPDNRLQSGSAEFIGAAQLHLLDFRQRLDAMLPQLAQLLQSSADEPA